MRTLMAALILVACLAGISLWLVWATRPQSKMDLFGIVAITLVATVLSSILVIGVGVSGR